MEKERESKKHVLHVTVESARSLRPKDLLSSDPYCIVELEKTSHKTAIQKSTLHPIWNETFTFEFENPWAILKISVFDHDDLLHDDFHGTVLIPVQEITQNESTQREYDITNHKENGKDNGHISITLRFIPAAEKIYPISIILPNEEDKVVQMKKDATAKDVVVLLCDMLNLPSKMHYGVVELKKRQETIVDDDTLVVKRMAEWVLEASSKDTELPYFRLRRVLYPSIKEIKNDLSIEELNFLFIQCFREVVRNPMNLTPDVRKGFVAEQAYRKVLPPKVIAIADASMRKNTGEVWPSSRVPPKSSTIIPTDDDPKASMSMPEKSVMIKFFDAFAKLNGSLQSVFPCSFMSRGYKPDGTYLPPCVVVGISSAGVSFLHKKTLEPIHLIPIDEIVIWKDSNVSFETLDLGGLTYILETKRGSEMTGLLEKYVEVLMECMDA
eukprot:TRINITY_DN1138_c1_g1_i7.p1 TRINITY_DN1138_c1_g1~~TRINITY_DN1138_c1_g1_i7.p1  ORF type:complete len:440 (+),score=143.27 TRINITY_DN1138_c1_g1_i7:113-1432(+)